MGANKDTQRVAGSTPGIAPRTRVSSVHCTFKGAWCVTATQAALAASGQQLSCPGAFLLGSKITLVSATTKILSAEAEPKLTNGYELNLLLPQEEQSQTDSQLCPAVKQLPPAAERTAADKSRSLLPFCNTHPDALLGNFILG